MAFGGWRARGGVIGPAFQRVPSMIGDYARKDDALDSENSGQHNVLEP